MRTVAGIAAVLLLALSTSASYATEILKIEQKKSTENQFSSVSGNVLDLQGTVKIKIDKDELRGVAAKRHGKGFERESNVLKFLGYVLQQREQSVANIRSAMELSRDLTPENALMLVPKVQSAAKQVMLLFDKEEIARQFGPELAQEIDQKFNEIVERPNVDVSNISVQYEIAFLAAAEVIAKHRRELDDLAIKEGVYVQLGAWLDSQGQRKAIHLDGFDNNPRPSPYDPDPWKIDLASVATTYGNADQLAKKLNEARDSTDLTGVVLQATTSAIMSNLANRPATCNGMETEWNSLVQDAASNGKNLKTDYNNILLLVTQFKVDYGPNGTIGNYTPEAFLKKIFVDFNDLNGKIGKFSTDLKAAKDEISAAGKQVSGSAEKCFVDTGKWVGKILVTMAPDKAANAAGGVALDEGYKFTERVLQLSFDSLPEEAVLSLRETGFREPGDMLYVKLGLGKGGEEAREIDSKLFTMEFTSWHLDLIASLIFVDPNGELPSGKKWHFAPSYSVLLKHPSSSQFYRKVIDLGFGLNVAALDLNGDGSVELGVGAVLSAFRDYLQFGYGYDIPEDRWYGFLGLRLPWPNQTAAGGSPPIQ